MFFHSHLLHIQLAGSREPGNHFFLLFRELLDLNANNLRTVGDFLESSLSGRLCEDGQKNLEEQVP